MKEQRSARQIAEAVITRQQRQDAQMAEQMAPRTIGQAVLELRREGKRVSTTSITAWLERQRDQLQPGRLARLQYEAAMRALER